MVGLEGLLCTELADVLFALGDLSEVERLAARAEAIATNPFTRAQAAYVAALLGQSDAFTVAVEGFSETPFLRARALQHRARVAPEHAVDDLTEAARLYARLPAPALHERTLTQLRSAGTPGRRAA